MPTHSWWKLLGHSWCSFGLCVYYSHMPNYYWSMLLFSEEIISQTLLVCNQFVFKCIQKLLQYIFSLSLLVKLTWTPTVKRPTIGQFLMIIKLKLWAMDLRTISDPCHARHAHFYNTLMLGLRRPLQLFLLLTHVKGSKSHSATTFSKGKWEKDTTFTVNEATPPGL